MDSKKILNLVTIVMFVITVVLLGLFMFREVKYRISRTLLLIYTRHY